MLQVIISNGMVIRNFPEPPTPGIFSKVMPVQMGGVLRCKWEAYCGTNGRCTAAFPYLQGLEASKAQRYKWGGGDCGINWKCTASTFQISCTGWGFLNSAQLKVGLGSCYRAHWFPDRGPIGSRYRPIGSPYGALFNCLIVGRIAQTRGVPLRI